MLIPFSPPVPFRAVALLITLLLERRSLIGRPLAPPASTVMFEMLPKWMFRSPKLNTDCDEVFLIFMFCIFGKDCLRISTESSPHEPPFPHAEQPMSWNLF